MKIAKVTLSFLAVGAVAAAAQQTTPAHRGAHPVTTHRLAPCPPAEPAPVTPANIPAADGKVETAFALRYIDVKTGDGPEAGPQQFYMVHYTGWLASDGTKFDSSLDRGEPITFQQGARRVIPGWDTGFGGMHVGGKRRLFIPYQLAYGERGRPPVIPPKSDLIFDIELVAVGDTPPEPPAAVPPPAQGAPAGTAPAQPPATQATPPPAAAKPQR